jgi:hypothetical protein
MDISAFRPLGNRIFSDTECYKILPGCFRTLPKLHYVVIIRLTPSAKPGYKKYSKGYYNYYTTSGLQFDEDFDSFIRGCLNSDHFDPLDINYTTKSILQIQCDNRDYSQRDLFSLLDAY